MTIKPGSMVRIKGCRKVWKVVSHCQPSGTSGFAVELHRRDLRMGEVYSIRQVWPVSMLQLVAAAAKPHTHQV